MLPIEDYSDERLQASCIHCGTAMAGGKVNRGHVPSKSIRSNAIRRKGATFDQHRASLMAISPKWSSVNAALLDSRATKPAFSVSCTLCLPVPYIAILRLTHRQRMSYGGIVTSFGS